jgi:predicted O-methyltransferase YrrM
VSVPLDPLLEEMLSSGEAVDALGRAHRLHSNVSRADCEFLAGLVESQPSIRRTLEVGCAYGASSLAICSGIAGREGARHVIVDPHQAEQWHGAGVALLRRAGIDFFELIEAPSEFALPRLAQEAAETFDFVFIDGWHTFDHTLVDIFYADRLVRPGGFVVIDDATMPSVAKAVSYLSRFPNYEAWAQCGSTEESAARAVARRLWTAGPLWELVLPKKLHDFAHRTRFPPIVAFRKTRSLTRDWSWFENF